MSDIEKVTKGFECCKAIHIYMCNNCPYNDDDVDDNNCKESLCEDALELLKEQAKRIETLEKINAIDLNPKWPYVFNNYRKVVLCKDCKYYEPQFPLCKIYGVKDADWFCADGELR